MSIAKKIIKGSLEIVKESAKQLADTLSPTAFLEQALGSKPKRDDEFAKYLKGLGGDLSKEQMEEKRKEFDESDEKKLEIARKMIKAALPSHMQLPYTQRQPRPYEVSVQEMERKKAAAIEAGKKQQQSAVAPAGKQPRGMLFGVKKKGGKGFEGLAKDTKVG